MITQQPLDETNLSRIAATLIERHHPLRVMLAVWAAARSRRREQRHEASDLASLNLSNRMRRDIGLPEADTRLTGLPIDIFNIKF